MRRFGRYIILMLLLLSSIASHAQNPNNLIATKNNLVLLVDLNSPGNELDTIFRKAAIKGVNIQAFVKGDFSVIIKDGWKMVKQQNNIVQFNRPLKELRNNPQPNAFIITGDVITSNGRHGYMDDAVYGVNNFLVTSVYELPSGLTRFLLPGYPTAKRVFLSGGFNDWSTLKGKMTKTSIGWVVDIKLKPGAYMYKFIVNSNWLTDPNNQINLDDGAGNRNSVYYRYNYIFKLHGFVGAKKVTVAGSFNNWKTKDIDLEKNGDTWECPMYLHDGTYTYRFMVDGKQIADPANANTFRDDDGTQSSILTVGTPVNFRLAGYSNAHSIHLAGNFNGWNPNTILLKHIGDQWVASLTLPSGNYKYKFIVDGNWMTDPANPVQATENGQVNSFMAVNPTYTFKLKGYKNAHSVHLAGTFNNWSPDDYLMGHTGDEWSMSLYLAPGKYLYKFIADGNWLRDPANKQWEEESDNSVLWLE